jgi:flagellar hook-basal body complex protein FliE
MSMSISSISSISSFSPITGVRPPDASSRSTSVRGAATDHQSFGDLINKAIDTVSTSHAEADRLALQAATGDLTAVHDYTIAATEAQLLTQLTVEVRNRAIEAFNDIMRMQV